MSKASAGAFLREMAWFKAVLIKHDLKVDDGNLMKLYRDLAEHFQNKRGRERTERLFASKP
jgi:hypothetical protein